MWEPFWMIADAVDVSQMLIGSKKKFLDIRVGKIKAIIFKCNDIDHSCIPIRHLFQK
jgi:hypothetical protein